MTKLRALVPKLNVGDIIKITLNANPATLGGYYRSETGDELNQRRFDQLISEIKDFLNPDIGLEDITGRKLPATLAFAVSQSIIHALETMPSVNRPMAKPVAVFSYQDGEHQMLTVTAVLQDANTPYNHQLAAWEFLPKDWTDVKKLQIPNFTVKERLLIESSLPTKDIERLLSELPFRFHGNKEASLQILEEYARHYRRYPNYFLVNF